MARIDIGIPAIIVPGLGGSDREHWQSQFERAIPHATRIDGVDWDFPELANWTDSLVRSLRRQPNSLLVAHSLGCALIAHVAERDPDLPVAGALLVAPADVDASPAIPSRLHSFAGVPRRELPFPSITVASENDPYMSLDRAQSYAAAWGSALFNVGACGHINVASGFGPWPEGERILRDFACGLKLHAAHPGDRAGTFQPKGLHSC